MTRRSPADVSAVLLKLGTTDAAELHLDRAMAEHVRRVIEACRGSVTMSAEMLGIPRRTLQRMLARKLARPRARKPAHKPRKATAKPPAKPRTHSKMDALIARFVGSIE